MTNHRGITLLEVVIAMGLVFVILLALSALAAVALKGAATGKHVTTATTIAQEKLEDIKREGYNGTLTTAYESIEPYESIADFSLYKRTTEIRPHYPIDGLQTVTVTVSWADDLHQVSFSTILAQ